MNIPLADEKLQNARILIVDDEPSNVRLLECYLQRAGYTNIRSTTDARDVLVQYSSFQPDIILLDLMMPHLSGFQVMELLKAVTGNEVYLPILVITADITTAVKERSLAGGAKDFLHKPFEPGELLLRIGNLLETRFLHLQLESHNRTLEMKVRERTNELEGSQVEILQRLARAAEFRDDETGRHTYRVARISALIAKQLGLPDEQIKCIREAAPLHDVGKIGISDLILLKPGKLTQDEFDIIKTHTEIGADLLSGGVSALMQTAETIALTHHERWDGTGYPRELQGEEIPLVGRILSIADVFDALTHERPYKKARSTEDAMTEIGDQSGRQFDPELVRVFHSIVDAIKAMPLDAIEFLDDPIVL